MSKLIEFLGIDEYGSNIRATGLFERDESLGSFEFHQNHPLQTTARNDETQLEKNLESALQEARERAKKFLPES